jgi:hypothetical protein
MPAFVPATPSQPLQLLVVGVSMQRIWRLDKQVDILGYQLPSLIGVGATFTSIYAAFAKFDTDQSEENRKFVREWLLGIKMDDRYWTRRKSRNTAG